MLPGCISLGSPSLPYSCPVLQVLRGLAPAGLSTSTCRVSENGNDQQPVSGTAAVPGGKHLFYHSITFSKMQIGI